MNSGRRIGLLVAGVAALVVAFFALSPSDSGNDTAGTPTTATTAPPPAAPATTTEPAAPAATTTEPPAATTTTTEPGTTGGTTATTMTDGTGGTTPTTTTDGTGGTTAAPQPAAVTITVRDGKPVGGVKKIKTRSGERVRIEVISTDTSDEVHLHGYDIKRDLKPGAPARFDFEAEAQGIFEIELEGSATQIAKLEVRPR